MKPLLRSIFVTITICLGWFTQQVNAQSILNPNDSVATYDTAHPPVQPAYGQIGKWVRTKMVSWNTNNYKAYIYKGRAFRLRFPRTYNPTANDGKKYPLLIFFHGHGESDTATKNELILVHGGQLLDTLNTNGTIDSYVLFMQAPGYWGQTEYDDLKEIVDYMIANNKVDPFHISISGLSSGGQGAWDMTAAYPTYVASAEIMSAASVTFEDTAKMNLYKYTPIWLFQGSKDNFPAPYTTHELVDSIYKVGGNLFYTEFPNADHNTWDPAFGQDDYIPFFKGAYSSNPWALFGKTSFFQGDTIKTTLGLPPGFQAYQWRKDSVVISGATTNTLKVTQLGTYDARVERNGIWSDWSHIPVVVKYRANGVAIPALIQAENYVAMHGVKTEPTTDSLGGLDVGYIDPSDYMDYDINVPTAGTYTLNFRVASPYSTAQFLVQDMNRNTLATVNVPNTGGWQTFKTISTTVTLPKGNQTIRLNSVNSNWNINWLQFTTGSGTPPPPPPPPPTGDSIHIEAESFTNMSGVQTETTSDTGGGLDVAYIDPTDWMDYSVNAPFAGKYTAKFRIASAADKASFQLKNSAGTVLATITVPNTGGWQTWQTISTTVTLPKGQQTLRLYSTSAQWNGWNINWWELDSLSANTGTTTNQAPTANAGSAQTITLPTNSVQLNGSGSDADGTISAYQWSQLSGPNTAAIASPASASTQVSGLVQGSYQFRLTVTDNQGATGTSDVTVTVNAASGGGTTSSTIHIEAESYSNMSGVATESTTDTGGGLDVAYIDPNDWMDYSVNVPAAGTYTVRFRVATPAQSGQLQLRTAAGTVLTTVSVPNTGGWQSWQTVSATVSLSAGQQTLRIVCTSPQWNGWNINWWELSGPGTTGQSSRQSLAALQPQLYENREPLGLYPNPIVDQVQLTINNALAGAAKVQVATLNGAIVKEYTIEKPQDTSQTQLSLASLPKGQYLLIVQMKGWKQSLKFMKAE